MTLRDVYHCGIDKDLFARNIEQAQTYAADMGDEWISFAADDDLPHIADLDPSTFTCASRIPNSLAESRIETTLRGAWRLASDNEVRSRASLKGHTPSTFGGGHMVARAELNNVRWVSHCRDLVQLPVAV